MANQELCIEQILQPVVEDLSQGVSQLVLCIGTLQHQEVEVSSSMLEAVKTICNTTSAMSNVAIDLGNSKYADAKEINQGLQASSLSLIKCSTDLLNSFEKLRSEEVDRKAGWRAVIDACKDLGNNTIELLQNVHEADVSYICISAEASLNILKELEEVFEKQDANWGPIAQEAVSKIQHYIELIESRATVSVPYVRSGIEKYANNLNELLEDLVKRANTYSETSDKTYLDKVKHIIIEIRIDVAESAAFIKKNHVSFSVSPIVETPILDELTKQEAPASTAYATRVEKPLDKSAEVGSMLPLTQITKLSRAVKKDLSEAYGTNDPKELKGLIDDKISPDLTELLNVAKKEAQNTNDAEKRRRMQDCIEELERILPAYRKALSSGEEGGLEKEKLMDTISSGIEFLDMIEDLQSPYNTGKDVCDSKELLEHTGKEKFSETDFDELSDMVTKLENAYIHRMANADSTDEQLDEAFQCSLDAGSSLNKLSEAIDSSNQEVINEKARDLSQLLTDFEDEEVKLVSYITDVSSDVLNLSSAIDRRDSPKVLKMADQLLMSSERAQKQLEKLLADPSKCKTLRQSDLEWMSRSLQCLRDQVKRVKDKYEKSASNPDELEKLKRDFDESANTWKDAYAHAKQVTGTDASEEGGSLKRAYYNAEEIDKDLSELDRHVFEDMNEIGKRIREHNQKGTPKEREEDLKELIECVDATIESYNKVDQLKDEEDKVYLKAQELLDHVDRLKDMQKENAYLPRDKATSEGYLLMESAMKLGKMLPSLSVEKKRPDMGAVIQDLKKSLEEVLHSMDMTMKKESLDDLPKSAEGMKNMLEELVSEVGARPTPAQALDWQAKRAKDELKEVLKAVDDKDEERLKASLKELRRAGNRLNYASNNLPCQNKSEEFQRLLPLIEDLAGNAMKDKGARDELEKKVHEADKAIDKMLSSYVTKTSCLYAMAQELDRVRGAIREMNPSVKDGVKELVELNKRLKTLVSQDGNSRQKELVAEIEGNLYDMIEATIEKMKGEDAGDGKAEAALDKTCASVYKTLAELESDELKKGSLDKNWKAMSLEAQSALYAGERDAKKKTLDAVRSARLEVCNEAREDKKKRLNNILDELEKNALKLPDSMSDVKSMNEDESEARKNVLRLFKELDRTSCEDPAVECARQSARVRADLARIKDEASRTLESEGCMVDSEQIEKSIADVQKNTLNWRAKYEQSNRIPSDSSADRLKGPGAIDGRTKYSKTQESHPKSQELPAGKQRAEPKQHMSENVSAELGNLIQKVSHASGNLEDAKHEGEAKPQDFSDSLNSIVLDISKSIQNYDRPIDSNHAMNSIGIANYLHELAEASRQGNSKDMHEKVALISSNLDNLIQEIDDVARRLEKVHSAEHARLVQLRMALQNYKVQLRILVSVKAISIEKNADTDESILSITRLIGEKLNESLRLNFIRRAFLKDK
ncbi:uncharacterized protein LOC126314426 [Schistocerca gregaria]|uniref:uncharacterized protein LOC126314426 n=1 Tax=Schistocerca gregaria TaxID=7010 RepID=UPI00211EA7CB|nr:uncharacterized protein LOC126314426 [Schistocerca gregaria]